MIGARALPTRRTPVRRDGYRVATRLVAAVTPLVLALIMVVLALQSGPALSRFGVGFLVARTWNPVTQDFGALPFIFGTLVSSFLALLLATPVGLAVALFLAEGGQPRLRSVIGTGVELLAAIPSVVYGLWALYAMAPFVLAHIEVPLSQALGRLPLFAGPPRSTSMLTAALVLAVMVLPTLAAVSRDVIRAVPNELRETSVALGATWSETTRQVILPTARNGIIGAIILALGRALGETIAVTMVIGNRPDIPSSLLQPAYTLASVIANEFAEATGQIHTAALIELGLVLMLVTLAINMFAQSLVYATSRRVRG